MVQMSEAMKDSVTYSSAASFSQLQLKLQAIIRRSPDPALRQLCLGALERIFAIKSMLCMPFDMVYASQAARLSEQLGESTFAGFIRSEDGLNQLEQEMRKVFSFIERQHGGVVFQRLNGLAAALAWDIIEALLRDFIELSCNRSPLLVLDALEQLKPIHRDKLFRSEVLQRHNFAVQHKLGSILLEENNIRGVERLRLWLKLLFPQENTLLAYLDDPLLDTLQARRETILHDHSTQDATLILSRDDVNISVIRAIKLCLLLSMDVSMAPAAAAQTAPAALARL